MEGPIIFQTLVPPHQATRASFVQGCTPRCPPAPHNLQEVRALINTFPQFSPPPSWPPHRATLTPGALVPNLSPIIPPLPKQKQTALC